MRMFKISAMINRYPKNELIVARSAENAINIFKERHCDDRVEQISCRYFTIWGWM